MPVVDGCQGSGSSGFGILKWPSETRSLRENPSIGLTKEKAQINRLYDKLTPNLVV